jgi:hypothetical protein
MPTIKDFVARGKVIAVKDGTVVFTPAGSNYELHLICPGYGGPMNVPIDGWIRMQGRKVLTVPSGGNFVTPILGPPRIVQGRVKFADDKSLVLQASCPIIIDLPPDNAAIDLNDGQIATGRMVNATVFPGATFELAAAEVARATSP